MSREEKLTIRCNRCGRTVTWDGDKEPPEELKDWKCLKVLGVLGEEHPFAIIMGLGIKNFDLCKECFGKFQETFLSILPPEILKAFEDEPEEKTEALTPSADYKLSHLSPYSKMELKIVCKETGLDTLGDKADMSKRIVEAGYVDYDPRLGLYVIGGEKYENAVEKYSQSNIKPKEGGDSEPNKEGAPGSDP